MTNSYYISIYDQNILFKNIIDDIIIKHSEGVNLQSYEERFKLEEDLFDIVLITMKKFWKERIVEEELKDCICNRIYKYAGYYLPPEYDENISFRFEL